LSEVFVDLVLNILRIGFDLLCVLIRVERTYSSECDSEMRAAETCVFKKAAAQSIAIVHLPIDSERASRRLSRYLSMGWTLDELAVVLGLKGISVHRGSDGDVSRACNFRSTTWSSAS
jgi:hypothetical protein